MIRSAIDKILELANPNIITIYNDEYSDKKLVRIDRELRAEPLEVATLSSLVDYLLCYRDHFKLKPEQYLIHVLSPTRVELVSSLDGDRKRERLMVVKAETPRIQFGEFIENEKMLIAVQSTFVDDPESDRAAVLKFAGTVTNGSIREYGDDGVTQKATIKQGVASKAEAIIPSPCSLRPFRTFPEVEQPMSKFIFRMRERRDETIESALYEADGGAWRNEARNNICGYLRDKLKDTGITVIS